MSRRRFFTETIHSGMAEMHGDEARHLTRVLRVEPGQRYEISDNRSVYLAEIADAHGDLVRFRVLETIPSPPPVVQLTLCAALIKFDRFEWMIEKATELGVARIQPVESARVEKGLFEASRKRLERWQRIARESSQQARRAHLPEISGSMHLERCLTAESGFRYFLEEAEAPPLLALLPRHRHAGDTVVLLVGPEGGWTDGERADAAAAGWRAASLVPHILRAETAATAALGVVMNAWMATTPYNGE